MSFTKTFSISTKISLKQNQKNRKMEFKIVYCVSKNVLKYLQNDKNKTYFTESWKITKTKKNTVESIYLNAYCVFQQLSIPSEQSHSLKGKFTVPLT